MLPLKVTVYLAAWRIARLSLPARYPTRLFGYFLDGTNVGATG